MELHFYYVLKSLLLIVFTYFLFKFLSQFLKLRSKCPSRSGVSSSVTEKEQRGEEICQS